MTPRRSLAELLREEGLVSAEGIEAAEDRQRALGGALDTALLELGLVEEAPLVDALARAAGLPPAPAAAFATVDPRARRLFPSKVAERHGLAPFALSGRELSIAATPPIDVGLLDELSFMISLRLVPHAATEWRVRELISRLYGAPLAPRLASLAAGEVPPPRSAPSVGPRAGASDLAPAGDPLAVAEAVPETDPVAVLEAVPEATPEASPEPSPEPTPEAAPAPGGRGAPRAPPGFSGFALEAGEPREPLAEALAQAIEAIEIEWDTVEPIADRPGGEGGPGTGGEAATPQARAGAAAAPAPLGAGPGAPPPAPAAGSLPAGPAPAGDAAPPAWSVEEARAALAAAATRDEVVRVALRHARDFFDFAAVFAVTRDVVAGHDALSEDGDARDLARTVAIYASEPGIFRTAIETLAPYLGPVDRTAAGTATVLDGLGRGTPRTVLVVPIRLRARPVCLLYADAGGRPVPSARLGELLVLLSMVGPAFERILRARRDAAPPPDPEFDPALILKPEPELPPPEPEPVPEPAAEPPLAAEPEPVPEPAAEPPLAAEPEPVPEPAAELPLAIEPEPVPEPAAELPLAAEPEPVPEPAAELPLAVEPEPVPEPAVEPPLAVEPEPVPEPAVEPPLAVEPEPGPVPEPAVAHAELEESFFAAGEARSPGAAVGAPAAAPPAPAGLSVDADAAELVGAFLVSPRGSDARAELLARLVERAGEVAPLLCEHLPGPLDVPPEALPSTPPAEQGPVMAAVAALGPAAARWLLPGLTAAEPARRRAAVELLAVAGEPTPLLALSERCFDPDPAVAAAACGALARHRRHPAARELPERLRRALLSGLAGRSAAAARALGALRDAGSIPLLIQALEAGDPDAAAASAGALAAITLQRHGVASRPWLLWWRENRGRERSSWLLGALTSADRELARAAAGELAELSPPPVPFSADLPDSERDAVARAWAAALAASGPAR